MSRTAWLFLAAVLLAPSATAVDLLPSEVRFSADEARLLVRSLTGSVEVRTEPPVLAARAAPGGPPGEFARTPRVLAADHVWHGLDGVVEVVLHRDDAGTMVDVIVEDGARTGVWVEWRAASAPTPAPGVAGMLVAVGGAACLAARGRRAPRRP